MPAWIKMREDLDDDPRTIAIARRLRLSVDAVIGKLFRLWRWANRHARDGVTQHLNAGWVDDYLSQSGFAESLVSVGWLDTSGTGLRFPHFEEHNWNEERAKGLAAERSRRYRERKRDASHAPSRDGDVIITPPPHLTSPDRGMNSPNTPSCPGSAHADAQAEVPALLTFPCDGPVKEWHLTQPLVDELHAAYPSLDILGEARKALAWVQADPGRKKTARGMRRFLTGWLGRAQDSGRGRKPAPDRPETTEEKLARIRAQKVKEGNT